MFLFFKKTDSLEGIVDGPEPADEGARSKEDEPQNGEAKIHTISWVGDEVSHAGQQVEEQSHTVDWNNDRNRLFLKIIQAAREALNPQKEKKQSKVQKYKTTKHQLEIHILLPIEAISGFCWVYME